MIEVGGVKEGRGTNFDAVILVTRLRLRCSSRGLESIRICRYFAYGGATR
jgi:hypothetical protein